MAVASKIEATGVGKVAVEDDRRRFSESRDDLDRVRGSGLLEDDGARSPRFGGITTGFE